MKKILHLSCIFLFAGVMAVSGQNDVPAGFDVSSFNRKFATARWLTDYDRAFWAAMQMLENATSCPGHEAINDWFCYTDADTLWHVVFLSFRAPDGPCEVLCSYSLDKAFSPHPDPQAPGPDFARPYALALYTASQRLMRDHPDLPVEMNRYVRREEDGKLRVWFFPSPFQNDRAVYGGEFSFLLSGDGKEILSSTGYYAGTFRSFPLEGGPSEISLDYTDVDAPTLGGILFVWQYKELFDKIRLVTARSVSTVLRDHTGEYYWIHVER